MLAVAQLHDLCRCNRSIKRAAWAAQYNTWLLSTTPFGRSLFFSFLKMAGLCFSQQAGLNTWAAQFAHAQLAMSSRHLTLQHLHAGLPSASDCCVMAQHGLAHDVVCKLFDSACSALMWMITRAYQHQGVGCDGGQGRLSLVYAAST